MRTALYNAMLVGWVLWVFDKNVFIKNIQVRGGGMFKKPLKKYDKLVHIYIINKHKKNKFEKQY